MAKNSETPEVVPPFRQLTESFFGKPKPPSLTERVVKGVSKWCGIVLVLAFTVTSLFLFLALALWVWAKAVQ